MNDIPCPKNIINIEKAKLNLIIFFMINGMTQNPAQYVYSTIKYVNMRANIAAQLYKEL